MGGSLQAVRSAEKCCFHPRLRFPHCVLYKFAQVADGEP
jgi:hypothetical protein